MKLALPALLAALALPAAAQQRLPVADQHVTAPAPLGQSNKESLVRPGDSLKQAGCGWVLQGEPVQRPARATTAARTGSFAPAPAESAGGLYAAPPPPPSGPERAGPPLVEAAYLTLRGTLASSDKGLVTIVDRNGRSRSVPLARGARVDTGLAAGDLVTVRIPLEDDPANKLASRVERQKPATPAPMSSNSSKFAQAQSAAR